MGAAPAPPPATAGRSRWSPSGRSAGRPRRLRPRRLATDALVMPHRRATDGIRLWSVRTQLMAPILIATMGLTFLGTVQTAAAVDAARDASRAKVLAGTATATVRLAHEIDRELAESAALRQRGGRSGEALVVAQRARVDQAIQRYRRAATAAGRAAPALEATLGAADNTLGQLESARTAALGGSTSGASADRTYHDIVTLLLSVADALPSQLRDPGLAAAAREVSAIAAVAHYHALERDQLRPIFSRGSMQPGELATLAALDGALQQRKAEFDRIASSQARKTFVETVTGKDVEVSASMRRAALAADIDPAGLRVDADAWYSAQSNTIRRLNDVGLTLTERINELARQVLAGAQQRAWATALGTAALAITALAGALLLAVRISRRLRRLREAALIVARHELPDKIAAVTAGQAIDDRTPFGSSASATTHSIAASDDEVGEVADAFASVHRAALQLAAEQAELRLDVVRMAEIFARRIRTLITRQLRLLDEFEREETDPEALARLFALDHLAARLRRNGENLLVLAGGEPGRPYAGAFPLTGAVTAAASEIEDFKRIETAAMDVAIAGPVVGDLVHLLAELLENATAFSPPETSVRVDARQTADGVILRVHDDGMGMSATRLAEINARLAVPAMLSSAAAGTMGLYVVARLAARHGIHVRLQSDADGTTAYVLLPPRVLAPLWATNQSRALAEAKSGDEPVLPAGPGRPAPPVAVGQPMGSGRVGSGRPVGSAGSGQAVGAPGESVAAAWFKPATAGGAGTAGVGAAGVGAAGANGAASHGAKANGATANGGTANGGTANGSVNGFTRSRLPLRGAAGSTGAAGSMNAAGAAGSTDAAGAPPVDGSLPRRAPGAFLPAQAGPPAVEHLAASGPAEDGAFLDPDEVRARLAGLAEGVSAALRRSHQTTPAAEDRSA